MRHIPAVATLALGILLSACAGPVTPPELSAIPPAAAVQLAAEYAPRSVHGLFDVHVKATGEKEHIVYLNSEADYRDQRNISIAISPGAAEKLCEKYGLKPQDFQGKHLLVRGNAARVTVYFYEEGRRTDKYYYQTHVKVVDPSQVLLLN